MAASPARAPARTAAAAAAHPPPLVVPGAGALDAALAEEALRAALCDYVGAGVVPTHTLVVSGAPAAAADSDVWALFRAFGDVAAVAAAPGARLVAFHDLRAACTAHRRLVGRCVLRGRVCPVAFAAPGPVPGGVGAAGRTALAVAGVSPALSAGALFRLFGRFGDVRDIHSGCYSGCASDISGDDSNTHTVVEYFDARCAARAARCLHRAVLLGSPLTVALFDPLRETPRAALAALAAPTAVVLSRAPAPLRTPLLAPLSPVTEAFLSQTACSPVTCFATTAATTSVSPLTRAFFASSTPPSTGNGGSALKHLAPSPNVHVVDGRVADARTTLMIRNIPNRCTQEMLRAQLDRHSPGGYDFLYLPIDFRRRCGVGYAFVNTVSPAHIPALHAALHNQRWHCFRSDKVCELAYARIQGLEQLLAHFQHSAILSENKDVRPLILLNGRYVPFPDLGVPIRVLTTDSGKVLITFVFSFLSSHLLVCAVVHFMCFILSSQRRPSIPMMSKGRFV